MKSIRDTCMEFFQSEDMKRDVKLVLQPMFGMVYNELYPYLWFLCIYHVFLIFIVLANLVLLLRMVRGPAHGPGSGPGSILSECVHE